MSTPSGRPSTITPDQNPQSPHIIPSDWDSICSEPPLLITTDIHFILLPPTKDTTTETSDETLHKNSVKPFSVCTLTLVHKDAANILPVPLLSAPATCKNRTQFKSLNIHSIFRCHQFRNQKHLIVTTNESLINSGLLSSTVGSFATIADPPKGKPIKKRRR